MEVSFRKKKFFRLALLTNHSRYRDYDVLFGAMLPKNVGSSELSSHKNFGHAPKFLYLTVAKYRVSGAQRERTRLGAKSGGNFSQKK